MRSSSSTFGPQLPVSSLPISSSKPSLPNAGFHWRTAAVSGISGLRVECSASASRRSSSGPILAETPDVAGEIAAVFGRQAVVAAVDVLDGPEPVVLVRHGSTAVGRDPADYARRVEAAGAGEILLQAIHRDGTREGFDLPLIRSVASAVDIPVIALGGAGKRADLPDPVNNAGAAAVAAGSLFVFQGRSGGVLVNFPSRVELEAMFGRRDL